METRVKRLERLNKVLFAGLALALLPWVVGAAETIPDLIQGKAMEAQQFNVTDETGNKVGGLMGKKDGTRLAIKDSNGTIRLFVGFFRGNPSILLADKSGDIVASFVEKNGMFETTKQGCAVSSG